MILQKIIVSTLALSAIALNYFRPDLFTATTTLLIVIAVLPWISSLIKSVEFPGGFKIEFQDLNCTVLLIPHAPCERFSATGAL